MGKTKETEESVEPRTKGGKVKRILDESDLDGLYRDKIEPKVDDIETMLIFEGKTLWQVAKEMRVRYRVFLGLCEDPKREALHKVWEESEERKRRVSDSLYKSAIGSYAEEEQAFKVRETVKYVNKKGKECSKTEERIKIVTVRRYLPPSVEAMKFWLANRDPSQWKNELRLAKEPDEAPRKPDAIEVQLVDPSTDTEKERILCIEKNVREGK